MAPEPVRRVPLQDVTLYGANDKPIPLADRTPAGERRGFEDSGQPIDPRFPGSLHPRLYDVPRTAPNANLRARADGRTELTPFDQLRALADFDLVRIVIEDVKGQIRGMKWGVQANKGEDDQSAEVIEEIRIAEAFVHQPDPLAGMEFDDWISKVLEEVLVTDALAVYPQTSLGGDPLGLVQIDGATIKPLIDDAGRPPLPPLPAYQQLIWGTPETEYTLDEMWYLPKNRRPNGPYGRSPVENVIVTVNLAIRTELYELAYYTSGTIPEGLFSVPVGWSPDQIDEFQQMFDDLMGGQAGLRAGGLRFVPGGPGSAYHAVKDHRVTYEQLEWLSRIIAWSFGVSPIPIVKMMNRSTGDTLETSTIESGTRPIMEYLVGVVNRYLRRILGLTRVGFRFALDEAEDAAVAYQRSVAFVQTGIATVDEARKEHGLKPLGFDELVSMTPNGPIFVQDILDQRDAAREHESKDARASGVDPNLISRQLLEVPIFTRDELRATLGLDPLGGERGAEIVMISTVGGGAPVTTDPAASPADGDDSSADAPSSTDSDDAQVVEEVQAVTEEEIVEDLDKWRRMAIRKVKQGDPVRYFQTTRIPVVLQARLLAELRRVRTVPEVQAVFAKADPSPVGQADAQARLQEILVRWFGARLPAVIEWAVAELGTSGDPLGKAVDEASINFPVGLLDFDLDNLFPELQEALATAGRAGVLDVGASLGLDLVTAPATSLDFAGARAAELVGRRLVGGVLVPNPDPRWLITEDLRFDIRRTVASAVDQGWSPSRLTRELQDSLGAARAENIARTETAFAYGHGAQEAFEEAGVEHVEIVDGPGCLPSGHKNGAAAASRTPGVVEPDRLANGQVWTVSQYRARTIGHPRCVRAAVIHVEGEDVPRQP